MSVVISVEKVSKYYRLGVVGSRTLSEDVARWWALVRGQPDPLLTVGEDATEEKKSTHLWALRDINFKVRQGEVLGVIGSNGAGKSTLLKILARVTTPTSGEVKFKGRVASLLEVGTGFHPDLTGRENIYLNGSILGMHRAEIDRKFDEIVDFSGVEKFIDTPVKRYSSGMYVRLAFAVAAHLEPEILIVDEVLAVGDADFQKKCLGKMEAVSSQGRTILFVSHNMFSIKKLCPESLWIEKGYLRMQGPSEDVISAYLKNSDSTVEGYREWPDGLSQPGVDEFKFHSVKIVNESGQISYSLDVRKPFWVELNYSLRQPLQDCRIGFRIYSEFGEIVFESYESDHYRFTGIRQPARYISRCEIPGDFLNTKKYFMSIYAGIPHVKYLAGSENVLALNIENTGAVGSQFSPSRDGSIRPLLPWQLEKQE